MFCFLKCDFLISNNTIIHFFTDKPECAITQTDHDGSPALVCTAHANPKEVTFTWRVKGMNETPDDMNSVQQHGLQSYLILDSGVDTFRTYLCYANNSVGVSIPCERDVAGKLCLLLGDFSSKLRDSYLMKYFNGIVIMWKVAEFGPPKHLLTR